MARNIGYTAGTGAGKASKAMTAAANRRAAAQSSGPVRRIKAAGPGNTVSKMPKNKKK